VKDQELEQALRRALRCADPGNEFANRVVARIAPSASMRTSPEGGGTTVRATRQAGRAGASRWGSVALAACAIAAIGLMHWRQAALNRQRALQVQAQLLQALSITSANINVVRDAVAREEQSN
jgi:hypothetical protein